MADILIVEDEAVLRMTFERFLSEDGHTVHLAADYPEALAALDTRSYDVVVSDIILGGKTGIDLLRTMHERGEPCEIIMITGDPSVDTAAEAVRLGAFDYLSKPVKESDLRRNVRLALDRRAIARERDRYAAETARARDELETIFESVQEGILTADRSLRVTHVNPAMADLLGRAADPFVGSTIREVFGDDLTPARRAVERVATGGLASGRERVEARVNGESKVFEFNAAPLVNDGGAVIVLRDVTRLSRLEATVEESRGYHGIIGRSAQMRQVFDLIEDVKETDSTVLICGESGTGKEGVAGVIQRLSARATGPYVKVNCAALSEDILESELFGHVKGAFTGALSDRVGRFEAANGGTILLDEIGDISLKVQLRLLRVLQEREFERVGDTKTITTDVRVIATTNQDLREKIEAGTFRQDLYYRLNVVRIEIPALRERPEDIPLLVEHFRARFSAAMNKPVDTVSGAALELLVGYPWEGNVRELENAIERAFVVCREPEIQPRHLPPEIRHGAPSRSGVRGPAAEGDSGRTDFSRDEIVEVLEETDWNVAKSARKLGVARNTLYLKMKTLGLKRPENV